MNIQKVIIIGLSIALVITLQYVVLDKWISSINQDMLQNSQNIYNQGLTDAFTTIYQQTENCQSVPIVIGNMSKSIFDVSCLNISSQIP